MPSRTSSSQAWLIANWREPAEAGVFASADAVFHTGVGSVAQLQQLHRADRPGGVGDEHLVAQALDGVENAQLGAGMRATEAAAA